MAEDLSLDEQEEFEEPKYFVRVTGFSTNTTQDALLNFFENTRRSEGGDIKDIQFNYDDGFADIIFFSNNDAERVVKKKGLQLNSADLITTLKPIPQKLPKDLKRLHVMGISERTIRDGLVSFMEVVSGKEVELILFGEDCNCVVSFMEPIDFHELQKMCKTESLDDSFLNLEQVDVCDTIEVSGFTENTTKDTILYRFRNYRNGGGDVKSIKLITEGRMLLSFEDPRVVDTILKQVQVIDGAHLAIYRHYPFLGETSLISPRGKKKERIVQVDQQTMLFIEDFFHQEFDQLIHESRVKCQQGSGEIVLGCADPKMDKKTWENSCEAVTSYVNQFVTEKISMSREIWEQMNDEVTEKCTGSETQIQVLHVSDFSKSEDSIMIRGKKTDACALLKQLRDSISQIEKQILLEKSKVTKKIDLFGDAQMELMSLCRFVEDLKSRCKGLEIVMNSDDHAMQMRGQEDVVNEGTLAVLQALAEMKENELRLDKPVVEILASEAGKAFLSTIKQETDKAKDQIEIFFKNNATMKNVEEEAESAIKSTEQSLKEDSVKILEKVEKEEGDSGKLELCGTVTDSDININTDRNSDRDSDTDTEIDLDSNFDEILSVEVMSFDDSSDEDHVKDKEAEPAEIKVNVGADDERLKHPDSIGDSTTDKFKENVETTTYTMAHESIESKDLRQEIDFQFDAKLTEKMEETSPVNEDSHSPMAYWEEKGVAEVLMTDTHAQAALLPLSRTLDNGVVLSVHQGDITKEHVDVIVNSTNENLAHLAGVAGAIVKQGGRQIQQESHDLVLRPGRVPVGQVAPTGPGNLPCKRIFHAVDPQWRVHGVERSRKLIFEACMGSFKLASRCRYSSIALPGISTGLYGVPKAVCAEMMFTAACLFAADSPSDNKLKDIRFVNIDTPTYEAFRREFHNRNGLKREDTNFGSNPHNENAFHPSYEAEKERIYQKGFYQKSLGSTGRTGQMDAVEESDRLKRAGAVGRRKEREKEDEVAKDVKEPREFEVLSKNKSSKIDLGFKKHFEGKENKNQHGPRGINQGQIVTITNKYGQQKGKKEDNKSKWKEGKGKEKEKEKKLNDETASYAPNEKQECGICYSPFDSAKVIKICDSGHAVCSTCFQTFHGLQYNAERNNICPTCHKKVPRIALQPRNGNMKSGVLEESLNGHEGCGTLYIDYEFPEGTQKWLSRSRVPRPSEGSAKGQGNRVSKSRAYENYNVFQSKFSINNNCVYSLCVLCL